MHPKQAWGVASLMFVLGVLGAGAALVSAGSPPYPTAAVSGLVVLLFFYILYKRYHVEVVPESDLLLFDSEDDLRLLCRIYGLDPDGGKSVLRRRLVEFSREQRGRPFVWVAPKSVRSLASALELEQPRPLRIPVPSPEAPERERIPDLFFKVISDVPSEEALSSRLVGGKNRSAERLSTISACPVCDAEVEGGGPLCPVCGADLEFYIALSESRVGRRMVSAKAAASRRKLRYPLSPLKGT